MVGGPSCRVCLSVYSANQLASIICSCCQLSCARRLYLHSIRSSTRKCDVVWSKFNSILKWVLWLLCRVVFFLYTAVYRARGVSHKRGGKASRRWLLIAVRSFGSRGACFEIVLRRVQKWCAIAARKHKYLHTYLQRRDAEKITLTHIHERQRPTPRLWAFRGAATCA